MESELLCPGLIKFRRFITPSSGPFTCNDLGTILGHGRPRILLVNRGKGLKEEGMGSHSYYTVKFFLNFFFLLYRIGGDLLSWDGLHRGLVAVQYLHT